MDDQTVPFPAIAARVAKQRSFAEKTWPKFDAGTIHSGLSISEAEALLAAASVLAKARVQLIGFCGFSEDCEIVTEIDAALKGGIDG